MAKVFTDEDGDELFAEPGRRTVNISMVTPAYTGGGLRCLEPATARELAAELLRLADEAES